MQPTSTSLLPAELLLMISDQPANRFQQGPASSHAAMTPPQTASSAALPTGPSCRALTRPLHSTPAISQVAYTSADTAAAFGIEPRVAMLSYSTLGSGAGPQVRAPPCCSLLLPC